MTHNTSALVIDALRPSDLPAAMEIQTRAYPPALVEGEAVLLSRVELANAYCFAARQGETLIGYLLAHAWLSESPPPIGTVIEREVRSEILFIHDLAVSPAGRGLRIGEQLVRRAFDAAARDGISNAQLIAVEGAASYWRRLGFVEPIVADALQRKLESYGRLARWMTCDIPIDGKSANPNRC